MADVFDVAVAEFPGGGDVFAQASREMTGPGRGGRKITRAQVNALPKMADGKMWEVAGSPPQLTGRQVDQPLGGFGIPRLSQGMDQLFQSGSVEGSRKRGLHNFIVGGGQLAAVPLLSTVASGTALVAGLMSGAVGSVAGKAGAEALGASPETADLVGDAGGALAGIGGSMVGPRAARALGAGARKLAPGWGQKLVDALSAVRDSWNGTSPAIEVPTTVTDKPLSGPAPSVPERSTVGTRAEMMRQERLRSIHENTPDKIRSDRLIKKFESPEYSSRAESPERTSAIRSLPTPQTPAPVSAESPVVQSVDQNRVTVLADILQSVGIPAGRVAEIPAEGWEMIAKSAGLSEHPDAATVQAAIAEMTKPKSPMDIKVRRRQSGR